MIYICAELFIRGQHGYRLVSDTFDKMDAPDKTVELLITQGKLSKSAKRVKLPVLEDGKIKSNKEILTFIMRDGNNLICSDYNGNKNIISDEEIPYRKFSNAEVVELIKPGNVLVKTLLGNWESYKEVVDSFYVGRGMQVSQDKLDKAIIRAGMLASNYTIDTKGVLHPNPDCNKDRLLIPDGVIDTEVLGGFKHIIGGRSLNRIKLAGRNGLVDLSRCDNLIEIDMIHNPAIAEFIPNENITTIKSFSTINFSDWKYLKYSGSTFMSAVIDNMSLGKSIVQKSIPERFTAGCKIRTLKIDGNIEEIGNNAFFNIGNTRELYIGDSVKRIGKIAFGSASAYMNLDHNEFIKVSGLKNVESIGEFAFKGWKYIEFDISTLKSLKTIGKGAFNNCIFYKSVVRLPDSVRVVGKDAFNTVEIIRLSPKLTDKSIENILASTNLRIVYVPEQIWEKVYKLNDHSHLIIEH